MTNRVRREGGKDSAEITLKISMAIEKHPAIAKHTGTADLQRPRGILCHNRDLALFIGIYKNCNTIYNGIINVFNKAISHLGGNRQMYKPVEGLVISSGSAFVYVERFC